MEKKWLYRTGMLRALMLCLMFMPLHVLAEDIPDDLMELSLEELMGLEVTSVSKRPQKQLSAPAAVFVITNNDIERWGVTNIPDALRMVPGLHVARIDANKWAISSRGFNSRFANKLLVLLDGRSVYTPLFAGVYWDALDTPLEDIERIEVIRGPGGTLWGANAVNGVINIISKSSQQTQGGLISVGVGNETTQSMLLRYGGTTDNGLSYRLYGKHKQQDKGFSQAGAEDEADSQILGFRSDWDINARDSLTVQGDYFQGESRQQLSLPENPAPAVRTYNDNTDQKSSNLLVRWQRVFDSSSDLSLQVYFDRVERDGPVLQEDRNTLDIDFDYRFSPTQGHNFLWGFGYRRIMDETSATATFRLDPDNRNVDLYTAFLQDEISLLDNRLALTLGSKFEHNDFTGFEYQPGIRLAWTPDDRQSIWAAASRAVRTPSRGEHDVKLQVLPPDPAPPFPVFAVGSEDFESEELLAYEIGYRYQKGNDWSSDLSLFVNKYDNLRTLDPVGIPVSELDLAFGNNMRGTAWGIEWSGKIRFSTRWHMQAAYTLLNVDLDLKNSSQDTQSKSSEDTSPQQQFSLWSAYDINSDWQFDSTLRYVGNIKSPAKGTDAYFDLDIRLAWKMSRDILVSVAARNLLDSKHPEFNPDFIQTQPTEIERSLFAQIKWVY
ncbi:MAG: TonB-dependent receptor [Gammaproteobacteria bacterium]